MKTKISDAKENGTAINLPLKVAKPDACEMQNDIHCLDFCRAAWLTLQTNKHNDVDWAMCLPTMSLQDVETSCSCGL